MANYKKLTEVEVMEEVSENTMALVEENGKLKKVPCGAGFGGGGNRLIIRYSEAPAPVSLEDDNLEVLYSNMTYQKFTELLFKGEGCDAILLSDNTYGNIAVCYCTEFRYYEDRINLIFYDYNYGNCRYITFYPNNTLKWTPTEN